MRFLATLALRRANRFFLERTTTISTRRLVCGRHSTVLRQASTTRFISGHDRSTNKNNDTESKTSINETLHTNGGNTQQPQQQASSCTSLRTRLLQSALAQVPEHGWTQEAILAAVRANHPTVSLSFATMLTAQDLIQFFMEDANRCLKLALQQQQQNYSDETPTLTERLHTAIQLRLKMVAEHVRMGRWTQGMALGIANPTAAWTTTQQLQDVIDIVVHGTTNDPTQISDVAHFGLGTIYVATECFMLTDTSPDFAGTWDFLRTQLQQWEAATLVSSTHNSNNTSSLENARFLASNLLTAFGHGLASVSAQNIVASFWNSSSATASTKNHRDTMQEEAYKTPTPISRS